MSTILNVILGGWGIFWMGVGIRDVFKGYKTKDKMFYFLSAISFTISIILLTAIK
ncbi:hypothetical protein X915_gp021 [Bacillus phage vB_BanS-Tsamsa]|uniref:Uncharacterized protein n=1 Tax=Bacillus phage vB_BanS-Tsamsa TaxID=1308863 RepID=U5JA91_9CAUD|nr:hypothetical protein X915_gp021 [Bacillus phage vB_BanS-Tsamsa]AGI11964.1 hypothetical protein [Bacillus phage vB_BanS-Tsamsa]